MYRMFVHTLVYSVINLCLLTTLVGGMEPTPSSSHNIAHPEESESNLDKCKKECTTAARTRNEKITHDLYKGINPREAKFYEKAAGRIGRAWFYCEKKCENAILPGGFPEDTTVMQEENYYIPDFLKKKSKPKFEAQAASKSKFVPQPKLKVTIGSGPNNNG